MVSLDDLAAVFQLSVREDTLAGGITVGYKGRTIVLTDRQGLASIDGRLVSLPAPIARAGSSWVVPIEFISRALALVYDTRLDLRISSHLLVVGDLRVPRVSVRVEAAENRARLLFDITPATAHAVTHEADRLVVRFEADALDVSLPAGGVQDPVRDVHGLDTNSIAIDLGPRFQSFHASDQPSDGNITRLVVEVLSSANETAASTTVAPSAASSAPETPRSFSPSVSIRTVVVDAGHGGEEDGAHGPSGVLEKNVTLAVARKLKAAIETRLGIRVVLTRDSDRLVRLDERAATANNNKADLFISLHANAALWSSIAGAEVFYLSIEEYGDEARRLAAVEPQVLPVYGGGSRNVEVIPWEMAQAPHIAQSAVFAEIVGSQLSMRVATSAQTVQQAPFGALVGANMPAVLVEMGFLSNPAQEKNLTSDGYQNLIVSALVESIVRFRDHLNAN